MQVDCWAVCYEFEFESLDLMHGLKSNEDANVFMYMSLFLETTHYIYAQRHSSLNTGGAT